MGLNDDLKRCLDMLPERILLCSAEGQVEWVSSLAADAFARGRAELEALTLDELFVDGISTLASLRALPRGEGLQCMLRHGTGTQIRVELAASAVDDGSILVVVRPVAPSAAAKPDARTYELVFEGAPVGIFHFDAEGAITACNDAFVRILGSSRRLLLGLRIDTLPDPKMRRCMLDALSGSRSHYEGEYTSATAGQVRSVRVDFAPIFDDDGAVIGGVGIAEDVTERRALEARLERADRLASLGTLAAGVAHEINNPLAYVMLNIGLIAKDKGLATSSRAALELAREGCDRVRHIVRDLRVFSRADDDGRAEVDVRAAVDSALDLATSEIERRARLVRNTPPVPPVLGNEARLAQVVLNLVLNAAQAIPEGDPAGNTITVTTGLRGDSVEIAVTDTGVGIPRAMLGHIFEPFWTTKPVGVGTGLGLSIVHGIVQAHGGSVEVESEPGRGSTFRVLLPPAPAATSPDVPAPSSRGEGGSAAPARILLVDDERRVVEVLRAGPEHEHEVVVESTGRGGLARLIDDGRFDLVVCDLRMPDMSGTEIVEEVRARRPELLERFVMMTGGAFGEDARARLRALGVRVLEKPFDFAELEKALAETPRVR